MNKRKDYSLYHNQRFGRLTILNTYRVDGSCVVRATCICDCGKEHDGNLRTILIGRCKSCGCYSKELTTVRNADKPFYEGTSLLNIKVNKPNSDNTSGSGVRGVTWDKRSGRWRASLQFKGKIVLSSYFKYLQDAIDARREAEDMYFKPMLKKYGMKMDEAPT